MPTNALLTIRPDYELVTRYGAAWQTPIINAASTNGLPTIDLHTDNATATNFFSNIESQDPILVNILGHGNYNIIACQNDELLLQGGVNTNLLAGRVVYNLSCRAGRDLGITAFNEGALSFLGYTEDFWINLYNGDHPDGGMLDPLQDEAARGFFESHNVAPISFINGETTVDSYYASQRMFNDWIKIWESIDTGVAANLMWNRDYQILYGEDAPGFGAGRGIIPLLAFAPLLLIPLLKK